MKRKSCCMYLWYMNCTSDRFGFDAGNYESVIAASSQYWNCSLSLSREPMERILLRDPLSELLNMTGPLLSSVVSQYRQR